MNRDELPADLEALYAIERDIPAVDPTEMARTLSAVSAAVAKQSVATAAGAAAGYTLKHMLTAAGLAFAGGAITYGAIDQALERTREPEPTSTPVAMPPVIVDAGAALVIDAGAPIVAPPAPPVIVDAGPTHSAVVSPSPNPPDRIAEERRLLDAARFAAARGDIESALQSLGEHRTRFRQGTLGEERDAMQIHLLVRGGRMEEARSLAARFRSRYPRSLLLRSIEAAVE